MGINRAMEWCYIFLASFYSTLPNKWLHLQVVCFNFVFDSLMRRFTLYILLIVVAVLSSCYTATESTPRIQVDDMTARAPKAEELVIDTNFVDRGCHTWQVGKVFISIEESLSPMLRPEGSVSIIDEGLMNKQFVYKGFREDNIYGDKPVVYLLFDCEGTTYSYYTGKSIEEIEAMNYLPLIPSLVDLDAVNLAHRLFVGKELYILTNQWYNLDGELINGRHLVPVTITDVRAGNSVLPLSMVFADERGIEAQVYISTKSSMSTQMLSFDRLFAYHNPRNDYPEITDEVWRAITEGRLLKGMTKQECRLSIGLPAEVKKVGTYNGMKEQWLFNTGAYLFFSDGLLEEFRQ